MEDSKKNLAKFFNNHAAKSFRKGSIITGPANREDVVYYLKSGYVGMHLLTKLGQKLTIDIYEPGAAFPMVSIIKNTHPRYYYEALTEVEVCEAPSEEVNRFALKDLETLNDIVLDLVDKFYKLSTRIEQLSYESSKIRISSIMLYLARHFGKEVDGEYKIIIQFSHKEIASLAGVTRETASRILKSLEKSKIIKYKYKKITVINLEKLAQIVKDNTYE